ncbi:MAG: TrmB family transcriptional regulator [Candidatus Thermoplasmatota archaeon]|nr:TrmB family transcriptional regulator [Candidatus Thermoplasmatota archaeon]MCL5680515.1 TrmB family transcriptional regulator [Candidatus Thermoplasmatota archaeon]
MPDDIFNGLQNFGLSNYEIRVYRALLLRGPQNSTDVVKNSGIPQPRVYDIFNNLLRKGLVESSRVGKKKIFRAVPVKNALGHHITEMTAFLEELDHVVAEETKNSNIKTPSIWLIENSDKIIERMKQLITGTKNEVIASLGKESLEQLIKILNNEARRGITIALVVFPDTGEDLISRLNPNIVIKKRGGVASEVLISDRSKGILNAENDSKFNYGLYFEEDEIIHILNYYFYHTIWWPSNYITDFASSNTRRISTAWLTCEAVSSYNNRGMKVSGKLRLKIGDVEKDVSGEISKISVIPGMSHTFYLRTRSENISVGGKTARFEDAKLIWGLLVAK